LSALERWAEKAMHCAHSSHNAMTSSACGLQRQTYK